MTKLHNCLATLRPQSFRNLVLCGDFNIDPQHSQNESLVHLQTDFQLVDEPTRTTNSSSTTIDLVFLSNSSSLISCDVLAPLATSDHFSVQVTLKLKAPSRDTKPPTKTIWLYGKADFTLAKQLLTQLTIASSDDNIDVFWRK